MFTQGSGHSLSVKKEKGKMKESEKKLNGLLSTIRFYRDAEDRDTWYQFVKDELENYTQSKIKECFTHCLTQINPRRNTTLDQDQKAVAN